MLFSHHFQYSIQAWRKSENLKIKMETACDVIYVAMVTMEAN